MINYDSPAAISAFLRERGLAAQKKFGQNFLINRNARNILLNALEFKAGDEVWEIGAGLGAMTSGLLEKGAKIKAFEIDHGFCAILNEFFGGESGFSLEECDVLKFFRAVPIDNSQGVMLFGNLPYNIAAKLLAETVQRGLFFKRMVITVQREVANRIAASSGCADYAPLSITLSRAYEIKKICVLKGDSFFPAPFVESCALKLDLKTKTLTQAPPDLFYPLLRALFAARRKTVKNNLECFIAAKAMDFNAAKLLESCEIAANERAERLICADFERLANALS